MIKTLLDQEEAEIELTITEMERNGEEGVGEWDDLSVVTTKRGMLPSLRISGGKYEGRGCFAWV